MGINPQKENRMSKFEIRIEALAPMRVAVFRGYGTAPEMEAHRQMEAFAREKGLIDADNRIKTFGFNHPAPWVTTNDEYGYEIWVVVGPEVEVPGYVLTKEYPGAKCAVTSIEKLADIGDAWEYLYNWVGENEEYDHAHLDGLEEVLSPLGTAEEEFKFNLYLPVK
jgi:DNA gyrase inhibitor GyrI